MGSQTYQQRDNQVQQSARGDGGVLAWGGGVDGDHVTVNWVFEMTTRDGKKRLLDELALQKWSGERIVEEQFYYDPAQLRPAS